MKRMFLSSFIYGLCAIAALSQQSQAQLRMLRPCCHGPEPSDRVLNFTSPSRWRPPAVRTFRSSARDEQGVRQAYEVGVSTDLFVWTASRRFAYELETTQEVKNMNFAVDMPHRLQRRHVSARRRMSLLT